MDGSTMRAKSHASSGAGYEPNRHAVRLNVPPLVHHTELERTECTIAGGWPHQGMTAGRSRLRRRDYLDQRLVEIGRIQPTRG
jgi:hypothetical protein